MSEVATYLIVDAVFTPDPMWLKRIQQNCNIDFTKDKNILNYKSLMQSGVPIFTYGAYIGILLQRKTFPTLLSLRIKSRLNIWKFLGRLLIVAVLVIPFGLLLLLIHTTADLALLVLLKYLFPAVVIGLLMFWFSSYLWLRFKLIETAETESSSQEMVEVDEKKQQESSGKPS
jgi:hypothetical protein